jgi:hypothetical protein
VRSAHYAGSTQAILQFPTAPEIFIELAARGWLLKIAKCGWRNRNNGFVPTGDIVAHSITSAVRL